MTDFKKLNPSKILLLRTDRIGDMLCTTPAIHAIRKAYPNSTIDLVASDKNMPVVVGNPDIDNLFILPLKKFWMWPILALKLRIKKYDLVVGFNSGSRTTSRLIKRINCPCSVGVKHEKTHQYYTDHIEIKESVHTIDIQLELAKILGADETSQSIIFPVCDQCRSRIENKFAKPKGIRRVAMFIGNAKKIKTRWPENHFLELSRRLHGLNQVEVYIVAGPGDIHLVKIFKWDEKCKLLPKTNLEELGAFLKTCDLFITSASGPMHLASAVDSPMIAIMGGYSHRCWRPLSDIHTLLNSGQDEDDVKGISVDQVYEKVIEKLSL